MSPATLNSAGIDSHKVFNNWTTPFLDRINLSKRAIRNIRKALSTEMLALLPAISSTTALIVCSKQPNEIPRVNIFTTCDFILCKNQIGSSCHKNILGNRNQ